MAHQDKIIGTWKADASLTSFGGDYGDFIVKYPGNKIRGEYDYKQIRLGGNAKANLYKRKGCCFLDKFGEFKAETDFVIDLPMISSGKFVAYEDSGRFSLFYKGTMFATGRLNDPIDSL